MPAVGRVVGRVVVDLGIGDFWRLPGSLYDERLTLLSLSIITLQ